MMLRLAYGASQLLSLLFCMWLRSRINQKGDKKNNVVVEDPAKPFTDEYDPGWQHVLIHGREPKKRKLTVQAYDLEEIGKQINQILMSFGILSAIHYFFGYSQPLFMQAILPWKNLLTHQLSLVHLWGCKAEGDLQRPWKPANPFGSLMNTKDEASEEGEEKVKEIKEDHKETAKAEKKDKKSKGHQKAE